MNTWSAPSGDVVELSKVEASRLSIEARNYALRTQHKQEVKERQQWQEKQRERWWGRFVGPGVAYPQRR